MEPPEDAGTTSWRARTAPLAHATRTTFASPVALRGLLAAAAGTIVLLLPNATTVTMSFVAISMLALSGVVDLTYAVTGRRRFGRRIRRYLAAASRPCCSSRSWCCSPWAVPGASRCP